MTLPAPLNVLQFHEEFILLKVEDYQKTDTAPAFSTTEIRLKDTTILLYHQYKDRILGEVIDDFDDLVRPVESQVEKFIERGHMEGQVTVDCPASYEWVPARALLTARGLGKFRGYEFKWEVEDAWAMGLGSDVPLRLNVSWKVMD